jgi:hypothetical protein
MCIVRKVLFRCSLLTFLALGAQAQRSSSDDVEQVRALVEMGALPRSALDKLQIRAEDRSDEAILQRTLYGSMRIEDTSEQQATEMVQAAERRFLRTEKRVNELKPLVADGVMAKAELAPYLEDLEERRRTLDLARARSRLLHELSELAKAEQAADATLEQAGAYRSWERYDGKGVFSGSQMRRIASAYQTQFGQALPVSAEGETAVHRALGYDHRGRVDVALTPDQPEGIWLRQFLEREQIPYFAFRNAIAGSATGAHIHIGPPSLRLRVAD